MQPSRLRGPPSRQGSPAALIALSALIVAAVAQQHRLTRAALQTSLKELERRVEERTSALRESDHRLKTLADNSPDIFSRFDRELRPTSS